MVLRIRLIVAGARPKPWITEAFYEYEKRLPSNMALELIEVPIGKRQSLIDQGKQMLKSVRAGDWVVALDERGKQLMSKDFAVKLENWRMTGGDISVLVGSADGLDKICLERANEKLSLSSLTFPHELVRVIFIEQLYRAWSIISGHPYHRV